MYMQPIRMMARGVARWKQCGKRCLSSIPFRNFDLFNPSEEHKLLRTTIRDFVEHEVDPQALAFNR